MGTKTSKAKSQNKMGRSLTLREKCEVGKDAVTEICVPSKKGESTWGLTTVKTDQVILRPYSVQVDSCLNLYVADYGSRQVKKIATNGTVAVVAPNFDFGHPNDVAISKDEKHLFVADYGNHCVYRIDVATEEVEHLCGKGLGFVDGTEADAKFNCPTGVFVCNDESLLVSDMNNFAIRKVAFVKKGVEVTTVISNKTSPVELNYPYRCKLDNKGFLWIADYGNSAIRKVNLTTMEIVSFQDFKSCIDLVFSRDYLFVCEYSGNTVTMIKLDETETSEKQKRFSIHGSHERQLLAPIGICVDAYENVYVAVSGERNSNDLYKIHLYWKSYWNIIRVVLGGMKEDDSFLYSIPSDVIYIILEYLCLRT
eukprot:TRINITY_DN9301_c0_g1_i1.p1 TRINITY_DN9301_c0_g1~~TRINITY_DN9301_c0_g1_i1.p1  ORF type:complete len:367 (-),score=39.94 TRINITY_DN9301_c0_g1_i1:193-1293(-)